MTAISHRKFLKSVLALFLAILMMATLAGSAFALTETTAKSTYQAAICYDSKGKQFTGIYDTKNKRYLLGNESLGLYVFSLEGKNYYAGANGVPLYSKDNIFGNTSEEKEKEYDKAVELFRSLETIRRYFKKTYGVTGDKYLIGLYNDAYDKGNNSFATDDILWNGEVLPVGTSVGVISIGTKEDPTDMDMLVHEYMHRVQNSITTMYYRGESGSVMEAYSDVFGELYEAGVTKEAPNWIHCDTRNLKKPSVTSCPSVYKGEYYQTGIVTDNGAVHQNSTVLSHAFYLMWNGIDGNYLKRIDTVTLGKLMLKAMESFKTTETFSQCATHVYQAARSMGLTSIQIKCVEQAFQMVGLSVK